VIAYRIVSRIAPRIILIFGLTVALLALTTPAARAHCELPCGIYHDEMRFEMIDEHLETIAKSMRMIEDLGADPGQNANQLARWVMNKEEHAAKLRDILTVYFLDQRIKPVDPDAGDEYDLYLARIETLHRMMVHVMKCKQTTDLEHVDALRELRNHFYTLYFGEDHQPHEH
jgi:nickel superoxide dismutase